MKTLITIGVVIVIIVGIIGFSYRFSGWLSGNQALRASGSDLLKQVASSRGQPASSGNEAVAADTYRDWSMYASDKYQFTLRYPSYLAVNPAAAQMLSHSQTETAVQFVKNTAGASRGTSITVTATAVADDHTLDQEIAEQKQKLGRVLLQQEMTIGGLRAIRLWVSAPLEGGTIQEDYVFVRKGSNVLTFSSSGDENRDLFEKMIKTVTFSFNR